MRGRAAFAAGAAGTHALAVSASLHRANRARHIAIAFSAAPSRFRSAFDRRVHPGIGCVNPARSIRSASSLPHIRPTKTVLTLPTAPKIIASFDRSNSASQFA